MQVPFKLYEGNINLSHTKPCLKKPRHLGMLTFFKQGLKAECRKKLADQSLKRTGSWAG